MIKNFIRYLFIIIALIYSPLFIRFLIINKSNKFVNNIYFNLPIFITNKKKCDAYDIDYVNNNQITGPMCEARNSMPLEELNFGMGDIFIRLAN